MQRRKRHHAPIGALEGSHSDPEGTPERTLVGSPEMKLLEGRDNRSLQAPHSAQGSGVLRQELGNFRREMMKSFKDLLREHEESLEEFILPRALATSREGPLRFSGVERSTLRGTANGSSRHTKPELATGPPLPGTIVEEPSEDGLGNYPPKPPKESTFNAEKFSGQEGDDSKQQRKPRASSLEVEPKFEMTGLEEGDMPSLHKSLSASFLERSRGKALPVRLLFLALSRIAAFVEQFHEPERTGRLAAIIDSNAFATLTVSVISFNSIFIAITTDYEISNLGADSLKPPLWMIVIDLALAVFYLFELALKLMVHRGYFFCNEDMKWNCFDFVLVSFSIFEQAMVIPPMIDPSYSVPETMRVGFLRMLRLFKLSKILRVVRTLRFFDELRLMVDCVLGSVLNMIWCLTMLFFVMFLFALLLVQSLIDYAALLYEDQSANLEAIENCEKFFGSTMIGVKTLFQSTTAGVDWQEPFGVVANAGWITAGIFIIFICLFTISVWNIVTSTFIEKALKLAQPDLDSLVFEQHIRDTEDTKMLMELFAGQSISSFETFEMEVDSRRFREVASDPKFRSYLNARGIDIKNADTFFRMLVSSQDAESIDIKMLCAACVRMKGFATSIDLQTVRFETKRMSQKMLKHFSHIDSKLILLEKSTRWPSIGQTQEAEKRGESKDVLV
eukprot:TRINITY_DN92340_c0_g1_i1.p1 TRINITY_DN92340_c0_g1~~TRINITY_DN92340_c0_g1_i1.p1  ORF type:complete len:684 (-),score=114.35 TRINITY_DN92340_c0_g1_i1:30-2054(-)